MITVKEILKDINYLEFIGNKNAVIEKPIQLSTENFNPNVLMWINDKNKSLLTDIHFGTIVCGNIEFEEKESCNYIKVANPRLAFMQIIKDFFYSENKNPEISKTAVIHPSSQIGNNVSIGHFVVVEEGCIIGDNSQIGNHNAILSNTIIGKNVKIGNNNTIGGVGFGYEKNELGEYELMPHIGNVVIKDNVEIGNNTAIDRAVLGSTILMENSKVDNLVHIAHGVIIGRNSLIIANAMIGGSTIIGDNVWFAPSASILQKKNIANNATIGMGAVILKDVLEGEVIIGNPGKPLQRKV
jgi:UDP-3-O-[3-hydroxymyristoyl] glucosamine N-acyltransferase